MHWSHLVCWLTLDIEPFVNHVVPDEGWKLEEKLIPDLRRKQAWENRHLFKTLSFINLNLETIIFLIEESKSRNITIQYVSALSIINNDTFNVIGYGITQMLSCLCHIRHGLQPSRPSRFEKSE